MNPFSRSRLRHWPRVLCLAVALTAAGQALMAQGLPALGEIDGLTVGDERRLGDQIVRQLYRDPDYIDDPVLQEYVDGIWQSLLQAARDKGQLADSLDEQFAWQVLLGKDRSVNAFALPGGYFGLHLGLINVVGSRDELASVMAHELTHVTQRHISRMMAQNSRQTPLIIASMILGALAASKNPEAGQAVMTGGHALAAQNSIDFTRGMEQEADRIGYGLMQPAGFDPQGFVRMFDRLYQANRLNDDGAYPYLRTHPLTSQRLSDIQSRTPGSRSVAAAPLLPEHALVVARSRVLSRGQVDNLRSFMLAAQGVPEQLATDPGQRAEQAGRLYGGVLAALQLRDFAAARQWAERLPAWVAGDAGASRLAQLLALEAALAAQDGVWADAAYAALDDAALARPELFLRTEYAISRHQADARLTEQWQRWLGVHPRDAGAWQQLGRLWNAQGQPLRAIRADAEAQVARLDYEAAIDRFKAGQAMVRELGARADHVDASIIQSRLAAVEQLNRERLAAAQRK
ncbi:peptidase M48 [Corticibacter populi]|uniref:Peptidase M48 n=1 Tax=Corticibacter populi TaxID=1550736 RepID=A0A3M6QJ36_9BURK|nr:M48 family metalloprotease [Corticibacter populi]RMX03090.1 peptidase M48 [Corticibacter populi]